MELDSCVLTTLTDVIARLDTEEFSWILRDVADARAAVDLQSELLGRLQRKASRDLASDGQLRGACIDRQLVVAVLLSFPGEVPVAMYGTAQIRMRCALELMRQIGGETEVHSHHAHRLDLVARARAAERLQKLRIGGPLVAHNRTRVR